MSVLILKRSIGTPIILDYDRGRGLALQGFLEGAASEGERAATELLAALRQGQALAG